MKQNGGKLAVFNDVGSVEIRENLKELYNGIDFYMPRIGHIDMKENDAKSVINFLFTDAPEFDLWVGRQCGTVMCLGGCPESWLPYINTNCD